MNNINGLIKANQISNKLTKESIQEALLVLLSKKAIEEVVLKYGRLDCAFNNAGIGPDGVRMPYESLTEISEKTWDLVVDVDMKGVFLCLKYIPYLSYLCYNKKCNRLHNEERRRIS